MPRDLTDGFNHSDFPNYGISADVDFVIRIQNSEYSFERFRTDSYYEASRQLGYDSYYDNIQTKSPLEQFVRDRLKRFSRDLNAFVIVTDYNEREGSFILTFSFFLFSTIMNYGSFRESLDYLKNDFDFFFGKTFSRDTAININYNVKPNRVLEGLNNDFIESAIRPVYRQVNILKGIVGLIGILALGFSLWAVFKVDKEQPSLPIETMQNLIRTEIEKNNTQKTNEELLRLLQQIKGDSVHIR